MKKGLFFKNVEYHKEDGDSEILKPEIEGFLKNREMYNLPGCPDITEEEIRRYTESNRKIYKKFVSIIHEDLKNGNWNILEETVSMIPYISEPEQSFLAEKCLEFIQKDFDENFYVREMVIKMIPYVSKAKQYLFRERCSEFFQKRFKDKCWVNRGIAIDMIPGVPVEERARLIQRVCEEEKSSPVLREAIKKISFIPEKERARLVQMFLQNKDPFVRREAVEIILSASEKEREGLFQEALLDKDPINREVVKEMISHISKKEKTENKIQTEKEKRKEEKRKKGLLIQKIAGQSLLYKKDDKDFFKKNFSKTGSEITLLDKDPNQPGETYRGKVIIRHIGLITYLVWRKAYEAHKYWKEKGFDYVPVEPIIEVFHAPLESKERMYYLSKRKYYWQLVFDKVDVFTRVINGPSVKIWIKNDGPYQLEIEEQIRKIRKGLKEMEVDHGHLYHWGNFVLLFFKNEDGTPDLSHPPRVYAIDFDMAQPETKIR